MNRAMLTLNGANVSANVTLRAHLADCRPAMFRAAVVQRSEAIPMAVRTLMEIATPALGVGPGVASLLAMTSRHFRSL